MWVYEYEVLANPSQVISSVIRALDTMQWAIRWDYRSNRRQNRAKESELCVLGLNPGWGIG